MRYNNRLLCQNFLRIGLIAITFIACNHYGLVDKLENPGGQVVGLYAFVTSQKTKGDMTELATGICSGNGISRADCACNSLAAANNRITKEGGRFVAWLANSMDDMTCRLQGLVGSNCSLPAASTTWYNTSGAPIASSFADLVDGNLSAPIVYTETGASLGTGNVWSGTDPNGLRTGAGAAASNCSGWADGSSGTGQVGRAEATDMNWSNAGSNNICNVQNSIYCFAMP